MLLFRDGTGQRYSCLAHWSDEPEDDGEIVGWWTYRNSVGQVPVVGLPSPETHAAIDWWCPLPELGVFEVDPPMGELATVSAFSAEAAAAKVAGCDVELVSRHAGHSWWRAVGLSGPDTLRVKRLDG